MFRRPKSRRQGKPCFPAAAALAALLASALPLFGEQNDTGDLPEQDGPSTPIQVMGVQSDSAAEREAELNRQLELNAILRSLNSLEELDSLGKGRISPQERLELEKRFRERYPEKVLKEKSRKKKKSGK